MPNGYLNLASYFRSGNLNPSNGKLFTESVKVDNFCKW